MEIYPCDLRESGIDRSRLNPSAMRLPTLYVPAPFGKAACDRQRLHRRSRIYLKSGIFLRLTAGTEAL